MKPVVVMKAAATTAARRWRPAFHTGAIVGGDDVFDARMRRAGVLRIRDFSELYHRGGHARCAACASVDARLAVVSNAGGPGAIAVDRADDRWLRLAELSGDSVERLGALLPAHGATSAIPSTCVPTRAAAPVRRGHRASACRTRCVDVVLADPRAPCADRADMIAEALLRDHRPEAQAALHLLDGRRARRGESPPVREPRGPELRAAGGRRGCGRCACAVRVEPATAAAGARAASRRRRRPIGPPRRRCSTPALAEGAGVAGPADSKAVLAAFRGAVVQSVAGALCARGLRRWAAGTGLSGGHEDPLARHRPQDRRRPASVSVSPTTQRAVTRRL